LFGAASLTTLSLAKEARAATLSCAYPTVSESVQAYFESVASSLGQVIGMMPDAPGLYDLERLGEFYPAEPGSEDDRLLQGALYLRAQGLFEMLAVPPSVEELAEKLSKPLAVDRLDREYFSKLLAATKERVAIDEAYAEAVSAAGGQAAQIGIPCTGWVKWLCLVGSVAIIVLLIIA
jgi:hypothetical protein